MSEGTTREWFTSLTTGALGHVSKRERCFWCFFRCCLYLRYSSQQLHSRVVFKDHPERVFQTYQFPVEMISCCFSFCFHMENVPLFSGSNIQYKTKDETGEDTLLPHTYPRLSFATHLHLSSVHWTLI